MNGFLPADGEKRIDMCYSGGVLNIDIFYEVEGLDNQEAKKSISFLRAKYFFKTPFPGYSFFACPDDRDISLLDSLVEYEHSDMLDMEVDAGVVGYKHYRLFLHSTGVAIHVIAKGCDISGESEIIQI